jgi:hypothetical protein
MGDHRKTFVGRLADLFERYEKLFTIIGGAWFFLTWADYSGFIHLPDIPFISGFAAIMLSTAVYALWWTWLRPGLIRRKKARELADKS